MNKTLRIVYSLSLCILYLLQPAILFSDSNSNKSPTELNTEGRNAQLVEDYMRAIELYKTALQNNPKYLEPLVGLAESYFAIGEYQEALNHILQAEVLANREVDLLNLEGRIRIGLGDLEIAGQLFARVLEHQPNNLDAQFGFAEIDIALGRTINATSRYLEALKVSPQNRRALLSLVLLFDDRGDVEKSEEYVGKALLFHPNNPQVRYIAAKHLLRRGKLDDSEYQVTVALQLNPDYLDATLLLSEIYLEMGEYGRVVSLIEGILAKNRDVHLLWYTLGKAYERLEQIDSALNAYATAFRRQSDDEISRIALENLIISNLPMDDPRRSRYAEYHFEQGAAYQERNFLDRALREYRRGLLIDPRSKQGRLLYSEIFNIKGFPVKYLDELKVLADLGFEDSDILDKIEIQESLLADTVSSMWNVNQYEIERHFYRFAMYVSGSAMMHYLGDVDLISYLKNLLMRYQNIEIVSDLSQVSGFGEAFGDARKTGSDYFYVVELEETERHFEVKCVMYSSATGSPLKTFDVLRTGNNRVVDSLALLSDDIHSVLPLSAHIIQRKFDQALIDLGTFDGVNKEDSLLIIKKDALKLKRDRIGFDFAPADIIGTLTVSETDELVSEGTIERNIFFDLINVGDRLVFEEQNEEAAQSARQITPLELFRSVLKIR